MVNDFLTVTETPARIHQHLIAKILARMQTLL